MSCLPLFLCVFSISLSPFPFVSFSRSLCHPLCLPLVSLSFLFHRCAPSAVSFFAVVERTNARCPFCVFVALAPSRFRVASAACPRPSLSLPLSDVRTLVALFASLPLSIRLSVAPPPPRALGCLFLAVVGRTNARFGARVFLALVPSLCRVTFHPGRGLCSRGHHAPPARSPRL